MISFVCCCCYWVTSVLSNSVWPYGLQPTRGLCPWYSLGRGTEWVAMPYSRGSTQLQDLNRVSGRFFTTEPPGRPKLCMGTWVIFCNLHRLTRTLSVLHRLEWGESEWITVDSLISMLKISFGLCISASKSGDQLGRGIRGWAIWRERKNIQIHN